MNVKQTLKFVILSIVIGIIFAFLLGMLFGIVEAFLEDMKTSVSASSLFWIKYVLQMLLTVLAISTAAMLTYKKSPIARDQIGKVALIKTGVSAILPLGALFMVTVEPKVLFFIVLNLIVTYVASNTFLKKYSA